MPHDGIQMHLGNIMKLSDAETRSITAENVYGEKGRAGMAEIERMQDEVRRLEQPWSRQTGQPARELGRGWKVRPFIDLPAGSTTTLMDVDGPAVIQHIWITVAASMYRDLIIRMYWDGEQTPSVEAPIGDFFCNGWKQRANIMALPINVNPSGGFNCYFPMPFRRHARITIENRSHGVCAGFFYAINYALAEVGSDDAYFHAQFRRVHRLPDRTDYTILDGIRGRGQYVGTYMAWQQTAPGWWGEGEIKFFIDGDREFPTICGTGTEDYFGGAWCFGENYSAPFLGYPSGSSDGAVGNRHSLYRFHIMDPVRFQGDLRVTMQSLGWQSGGRFLHQQDDIASVAYWYQCEPHAAFPALPDRQGLAVAPVETRDAGCVIPAWSASRPVPGLCDLTSLPAPGAGESWRTLLAGPGGLVELDRLPGADEGLTCLTATVDLAIGGRWSVVLGYDCLVRLFIDGVPVYTDPATTAASPAFSERTLRLRLAAGRHRIDLACIAGDTRGVSLRLSAPGDAPQTGRLPCRCVDGRTIALGRLPCSDIAGDLSLYGDFQVFAGGMSTDVPIDLLPFRSVPESLRIGGEDRAPVRLRMGRTGLDLESLAGAAAGGVAYAFASFTVDTAGPFTLGFCADWWVDACIDGVPAFTTGSRGNGNGDDLGSLCEHLVHLDLARGTHLLALRFVRGTQTALLRVDGPHDLRALGR